MKDKSFDYISLKRLATSYLENGTERIELAGFQRGAAWKAWNVEALWDSLLRWFPIGSLLLARANEFIDVGTIKPQISKSGNPQNLSEENTEEDLFLLIDGQQRSNAIALGFIPYYHPYFIDSGARLWIDLGEPNNPDSKKFDFYLCTLDDPFGENISFNQKRNALESINQGGKDDSELNLFETYPVKAKLPVPFAEFIDILSKHSNWNEIRVQLLSESTLNLPTQTHKVVTKKLVADPSWKVREEILVSIRKVILEEEYKIPVVLFRKRENHVTSKELGKLFERINVNGVTPPQAELFFSALKLMYPKIGDFVAEVNRNEEIKGLLKPTQIILSSIRVINPDITEVSTSNFERITNEHGKELLSLLENEVSGISKFSQIMLKAYKVLHYQGKGDYGLPKQLIQRLRPRVWHNILLWIYINHNNTTNDIPEDDRFNIVRFAILDLMDYFIFTSWWAGYSRYVNNHSFYKLLKDATIIQPGFSAQGIFDQVRKRVQWDNIQNIPQLHILSPQEYFNWIIPGSDNKVNWNSFSAGDIILMYAQREYLYQWESLNDIDKDHIIPYSWMNFAGPNTTSHFWKVETNSVKEGRSPVINNPGNFRYWPASLNRQYQDARPSIKHIHKNDYSLDIDHQKRGLKATTNVLEASSITLEIVELIDQLELLKISMKDERKWTTEQYDLFTKIIYKRCFLMYEELYTTLRLNEIH